MARLRYNNALGTLGASLTASGTTITFAAAPSFPTITGTDYIPLVLEPPTTGPSPNFEVVWLTAYTAGAATGTITRGQDGTTGVAHASGVYWTHGPLVLDLDTALTSYVLADDVWLPARQGLLGWTCEPAVASATQTPTAGSGKYARIYVPRTITISTAWVAVTQAGTGATALANCYVALYTSAGTRIGVTADQSTPWATAGAKSATLTVDSGQSLTITGGAGVYIWAFLLVGTQSTTNVAFSIVNANSNSAIGANMSTLIAGQLGSGLTAAPATFTPSTVVAGALFWVAVS